MFISDQWKDYELLDAEGGERLERWGEIILIRPDPQIIFSGERRHPGWKNPNGRYFRSRSGGGSWEFYRPFEDFSISYKSLKFHIRPTNFKHTGLFPEQAANWDWVGGLIARACRPIRVLNLFAYTGAATCACAAAGAQVCHVDAARGMVQWAKENAALSGLAERPVRYLVDDCEKFVERELRRGNRYDAIIMDPPSYGRGPGGEVWKLEEKLDSFVALCARLLSDDPLFFLINSYTTGLAPGVLQYLTDRILPPRFGGKTRVAELGLPVTASGLVLPCGASARWSRED